MPSNSSCNAIAVFVAARVCDASSVEERQTLIRNFALENSLTIVSFLAVETGKLAAGLGHALSSCKNNHANIIIFDEISKLKLSRDELLEFFSLLTAHEMSMVFAKEKSLINNSTIDTLNRLLIHSRQIEKEQLSQKIKKSLRQKKRKGGLLGGRKFGSYPTESPVIKQIIKLRDEGISLQTICQKLAESDIKTAQNKTWHPTTIKRILERAALLVSEDGSRGESL